MSSVNLSIPETKVNRQFLTKTVNLSQLLRENKRHNCFFFQSQKCREIDSWVWIKKFVNLFHSFFVNFCGKCIVWKLRKFSFTLFWQKFRQTDLLCYYTKEVRKELISRIIFFSVKLDLLLTVWKNAKLSLTEKIFREINSLVTSLVKTVLSRNFCQKCMRENFRNFHTVLPLFFGKNFVKRTFY